MFAQKLKPTGVLGGIAGLIGFSALAGVLVTALVTPALAVTGTTAKGTIGIFENLPDFIQIGGQSQQNQIYGMRAGAPVLIATTYKQNRQEVSWENVSPFLKDAAVAGEDRRFFTHGGVDVPSIARASLTNSSTYTSGSSTLDMQLVKNILLQEAFALKPGKVRDAAMNAAIETTIPRKLKEMKLAIGLDKRYTKKEILLGYLNIVGMGSNTYGVESAALQYFSVHAKDVTLAQAASLVAIVQGPNKTNLGNPKNYPANKARRDQILDAMLDTKKITQKQHDEAIATKIADVVKPGSVNSGCRNAIEAGFPCDYVTKLITAPAMTYDGVAPVVEALGATPADRQANWDKGGYKVYTSIDLDLQKKAQDILNEQAPPSEARFQLGAASDTVEVGTGRILAMAQNKKFDDAEGVDTQLTAAVNYSTDQPYGNSTGFPTGSTFKVIDLANWLQNGHGLNDLINGNGPGSYKLSDFTWSCDPSMSSNEPFKVPNDGGAGGGYMTVKAGLVGSVNNVFMRMAQKQDMCSIRDTATAMGVHLAKIPNPLVLNPTFVLGTNAIAPLTMAAVAATVGGGGLHCTPIIIDKVINPAGKTLDGQRKTCNQALTADVAAGTANAMVASMTGGTSAPANPRDGIAIGGKTGTSSNTDNDWVMGTTTKIATAVWTGNVTGSVALKSYRNPITGGNYYTTSRFNILKAVMRHANAAYPGEKAFPVASAAVLGGSSATVPSVVGQTASQAQALLESLQFQYQDGGPVASGLPVGRVVSTDPTAGSKVAYGAMITVYTSDGSLATTMPNVVGMTLKEANSVIDSYGFSSSNILITWVAGSPLPGQPDSACNVQSSNPSAGSPAAKTDSVTLAVYGSPAGKEPTPACKL